MWRPLPARALGRRCQVFSRWFSGSGFLSRRTPRLRPPSQPPTLPPSPPDLAGPARTSRARTRTRRLASRSFLPARPRPAEQRLPPCSSAERLRQQKHLRGRPQSARPRQCARTSGSVLLSLSSSARAPGPERIPRRRVSWRVLLFNFDLRDLFFVSPTCRGDKGGGKSEGAQEARTSRARTRTRRTRTRSTSRARTRTRSTG